MFKGGQFIIRVHVDTYRKEYFDRISFLKQSSKIDVVCGVRPLINYSWSSVEIPCWFTSTGTYKVIWKKNLLAFYHKSERALFYLMHFIPLKKHSLMLRITCTIILWTHPSADLIKEYDNLFCCLLIKLLKVNRYSTTINNITINTNFRPNAWALYCGLDIAGKVHPEHCLSSLNGCWDNWAKRQRVKRIYKRTWQMNIIL